MSTDGWRDVVDATGSQDNVRWRAGAGHIVDDVHHDPEVEVPAPELFGEVCESVCLTENTVWSTYLGMCMKPTMAWGACSSSGSSVGWQSDRD